jgi:protein-histidine N-methyltransferase
MPVSWTCCGIADRDAIPAAQVSFEDDVVLSQMNEYEVLQLLMGDCRERLAAYNSNAEDEIKLLQRPETTIR